MDLSVIIVTWNSESEIEQCLESVFAFPSEASFEVVVVDNASSDKTVPLIKERFPQVQLIENCENLGFVGGNNRAVELCRGANILLLNPDTIVKPHAFDSMLACLTSSPAVGVVGPRLLNADGTVQLTGNVFPNTLNLLFETLFLDRLFPRSRLFGRHKMSYWDHASTRDVDWVMGACLMTRRDVIDRLGLFDPEIFMYFEETDFCYRVRQAGLRTVYCAEAEVIHLGGIGVSAYNQRKIVEFHRSLFYYFHKHYSLDQLSTVRLLVLTRALIRGILWLALLPVYGRRAIDRLQAYAKVIALCVNARVARN